MQSWFRRERGQELIEFALVLPILAALVFGVVEFGLIIFSYNTIGDAAQVGARYGVVHPTECANIQGKVYQVTDAARLRRANLAVPCPTLSGGAIRVEVTYNYYSQTSLFSAFMGRPLVLKSVATMVYEASQG
jgi:Flp pilus assembly protein TadG